MSAEYWVLEIVVEKGKPIPPSVAAKLGTEGCTLQLVNGDIVRAIADVPVEGDDHERAQRVAVELAARHTRRYGVPCKVTLSADA